MARPLSIEDRRECWDTGIAAAFRHHVEGTPIASPWDRRTRRNAWFHNGARAALHAIARLRDARP